MLKCIHVRMCVCVCVCMYVYVCIYTYTYTYILVVRTHILHFGCKSVHITHYYALICTHKITYIYISWRSLKCTCHA
jgi:hypothetical protein